MAVIIITLKIYKGEINEWTKPNDNETVDCSVYRTQTAVCLKWEAGMQKLCWEYKHMSPGSHAVVEMYFIAMKKKEELVEAYHRCMRNEAYKVTTGVTGKLYKVYSKGMDEELFKRMFTDFSRELFEASKGGN